MQTFNDGIIHCHIRKDDPQLSNSLLLYVDNLIRQYFNEISKPLLAHLQADYQLPQSDPTFIDFLHQWRNENQIKEYYLIDKNGSLLVINNNNEHYYFIVHTDRTLNAFTELYHDAIEVSHFVSIVKQRHKIYFFGAGKDAWDFNSEEWGRYFHSPHLLHGRESYYWVVIPGTSAIVKNGKVFADAVV